MTFSARKVKITSTAKRYVVNKIVVTKFFEKKNNLKDDLKELYVKVHRRCVESKIREQKLGCTDVCRTVFIRLVQKDHCTDTRSNQ